MDALPVFFLTIIYLCCDPITIDAITTYSVVNDLFRHFFLPYYLSNGLNTSLSRVTEADEITTVPLKVVPHISPGGSPLADPSFKTVGEAPAQLIQFTVHHGRSI
jgi:hypothetical protein